MESISGLEAKLKNAESEIKEFVAALKKENLRLHKKIAKFQAERVTLQNEIELLIQENAHCVEHRKNLDSLSNDELEKAINDQLIIRRSINQKRKD